MDQQINLKEQSMSELKALVYDRIAIVQRTQEEIKIIEQEIGRRLNAPPVVPTEAPVTPETV